MAVRAGTVTVGTRGSALALRQTESMVRLLRARHPERDFLVREVTTRGDVIRDRPISEVGDKGIFIRALERSLLEGEIDIAVHSLKDVPADSETDGLVLAAFSQREDPRDVVISAGGKGLRELGSGAVVGTGSARRRVQLLALRPDLIIEGIRGNVDTRLRKLESGEFDAIVLAAAGLNRLGIGSMATQHLTVDECTPDAGQGIVVLQTRVDGQAREVAQAVDDAGSRLAARVERAVVRGLQADCHSPVGAYATSEGESVVLRAMAARDDGSGLTRLARRAPPDNAEEMAFAAGRELLDRILNRG